MEIHQLRTFVAVAREGSITRASERLYLSQPAVSAHIKAIEETLGLSLFARTPKGMRLTEAGAQLLTKAEQTLEAHRQVFNEAARLKGRLGGRLRLGIGGDAAAPALGRLLTALSDRHPDVETVLTHAPSRDVLEGLRTGRLDAGFYNEAGHPGNDLAVLEVGHFAIHLAAPAGLVRTDRPLDWTALAELPWISPTAGTCCGRAAETLFEQHNIRPKRILDVDRESVTGTLIAGGVGIGLLHADTAERAVASGAVDILCEAEDHVRVLFVHLAERAEEPMLVAARAILAEAPQSGLD